MDIKVIESKNSTEENPSFLLFINGDTDTAYPISFVSSNAASAFVNWLKKFKSNTKLTNILLDDLQNAINLVNTKDAILFTKDWLKKLHDEATDSDSKVRLSAIVKGLRIFDSEHKHDVNSPL
jgi:hypothetical protein